MARLGTVPRVSTPKALRLPFTLKMKTSQENRDTVHPRDHTTPSLLQTCHCYLDTQSPHRLDSRATGSAKSLVGHLACGLGDKFNGRSCELQHQDFIDPLTFLPTLWWLNILN